MPSRNDANQRYLTQDVRQIAHLEENARAPPGDIGLVSAANSKRPINVIRPGACDTRSRFLRVKSLRRTGTSEGPGSCGHDHLRRHLSGRKYPGQAAAIEHHDAV